MKELVVQACIDRPADDGPAQRISFTVFKIIQKHPESQVGVAEKARSKRTIAKREGQTGKRGGIVVDILAQVTAKVCATVASADREHTLLFFRRGVIQVPAVGQLVEALGDNTVKLAFHQARQVLISLLDGALGGATVFADVQLLHFFQL